MSRGATGDGRSSSAARLVARAARPAVRPREEFPRSPVVELEGVEAGAQPDVAPPVRRLAAPHPQSSEPRVSPSSGVPVEVAMRPAPRSRVADETSSGPSDELERAEEVEPPAPAPSTSVERQHGASRQRDPEPVRAADAPHLDVVPTWTLVDPPILQADTRQEVETVARQDAPGWQSLAQPQESDARLTTRAEPQPAVAAAARARAPAQDVARAAAPAPVLPAAAATAPVAVVPQAQPAPPSAPTPAPPGPPQVLIDRIEVITPPAHPPAPDPFLSLAARRVGASRHGGST